MPSTSTGLTYALSNFPTGTPRILVTNGAPNNTADPYCYSLPSKSGTVPWTSFNTKCFDTPVDGVALTGPPQMATQIEIEVNSTLTPTTFDFCVTALSF